MFLVLAAICVAGIAGCVVRDEFRFGEKRCIGAPRACVGDARSAILRAGLGELDPVTDASSLVFVDDDRIVYVIVKDDRIASIRVGPRHSLDP